MKPTEQIANSASTPKAGLFATLRGLLTGKGSGLSKISFSEAGQTRSLVVLCALAGLLALSTGVAHAEAPRLISYGSFSTGPVLAEGIAVDQASGAVYVASLARSGFAGLGHVDKFDAAGKLLPPSPFAEGLDPGAAVNPINGNLYVLEGLNFTTSEPAIATYDPNSGALVGTPFSVPASNNVFGSFTAVQIAADAAGNVYVPVIPQNEVVEYSSSGTLLRTFTGEGTLKGPTGVAVDPSGKVWVADRGNNRIEELSSTDTVIGSIKSEGVGAVAVDTRGDVFAMVDNGADFCGSLAPPCSHLVEYISTGAQLADVGAGTNGSDEFNQLAVNDANGRVYVTDVSESRVQIYGPPTAPAVDQELAAEVSTSEAKLGARISPGGIETAYRFEYGTTASYGQTTPFPEGSVGQGLVPRTVWASASGFAPATTYHYRVVATNELGTVVGLDQTFTTAASEARCPNEDLRGGFSQSLPDCRAYELVTPPNSSSTQPDPTKGGNRELAHNQAAREGNRMAYLSIDVLPGSDSGGESYVATRTGSGWSSESALPRQSYDGDRCSIFGTEMQAYSADVSKAVLFDGGFETVSPPTGGPNGKEGSFGGGCGSEGLQVVSGEPVGVENLLLRDNTSGAYSLINVPPPGVIPANAVFQGASSDLSHVVFDEQAALTPGAPTGVVDLYERAAGVLRLLTVLPNGTPVTGSLAENGPTHEHAVVGEDPSSSPLIRPRTFFTAGGNLYVRENPEQEQSALVNGDECTQPKQACTVQVNASQAGGGGGGGRFQDASADGSRVFFTDETKLTADSTAESGAPDLYECELPEETGKACNLTDLTVAGAGEHANVQGLAGVSKDGSYVYLVADGVLASNENANKETAAAGEKNLYVRRNGATTFIATLNPEDPVPGGGVRVSPNGAFLAFASDRSLTGYDNTNATGTLAEEIFLYNAASNQLVCASCNPSGERPPSGDAITGFGGATMTALPGGVPHYLSDSGRLFFETTQALLPSDTNGQIDVYEFEGGQLHLISTGTSSSESVLLDASENGNDVFFLTRQKLVPQDTEEEARNIYDARVGGGFPASSSPPPCTTADACRTPVSPQPSIFGAPSSATFSGAGNLTPPAATKPKLKRRSKPAKCKKGFVKKRGKCVKKPTKKARKSAHVNKRTGK